jgi:hypothetical protein
MQGEPDISLRFLLVLTYRIIRIYFNMLSSKNQWHQQRWPRPLPGAILIPPALLVFADLTITQMLIAARKRE